MEEVEHLQARLVDGGDDRRPTPFGDPSDAAHDVVGRGAVEPACRLVEEDERRRRQQLDADAHALALAAADAFAHAAADPGFGYRGEPHLLDSFVGTRPLLQGRDGVRQLELRRVAHGLRHRQRRHQHVVLGDVRLQ